MNKLSNVGRKTPLEWASEVPESQQVSLADLERVVATYHGATEADLAPEDPRRRDSNIPSWLFIAGLLAIFMVPLFGAMQYWGGGGGIRGGNLSVEYDPGRASVIVPVCFSVLSVALVATSVGWVRGGRYPGGGAMFFPLYFGGCAALGLLLASVRGVSFASGGSVELLSMWICLGVAVAALIGYFVGVKRTEEARQVRARRALRSKMVSDRMAAGKILVSRGVIEKSEYDGMHVSFGSFLLMEDRK